MENISRLEEYKKENPSQLTEEQFEILEQEILHPKKGTDGRDADTEHLSCNRLQ